MNDELKAALDLVLEAAWAYAGEYGFITPDYCTKIFNACELLEKEYLD